MIDNIKQFVIEIISKRCKLPELSKIDLFNYIDAGHIDSMALIKFLVEIESKFDIEISAEDLVLPEFKTIGGLVSIIDEKLKKKDVIHNELDGQQECFLEQTDLHVRETENLHMKNIDDKIKEMHETFNLEFGNQREYFLKQIQETKNLHINNLAEQLKEQQDYFNLEVERRIKDLKHFDLAL